MSSIFVHLDDNFYKGTPKGETPVDNITEKFVNSVREYLEQNGMTVTAFARRIGCLERCVARWLNGTNIPSTEYVIKTADALHWSVDYLFERTDRAAFMPAAAPSSFSERLHALLSSCKENKRTLARIWQVEPSALTKWLNGSRMPKPDTVYKLADFFNCSMDYLLGRTDIP